MENLDTIFANEAADLIADLEKGLLELEKDPTNKEALNTVFRSMHTIKGSAGMLGFQSINTLTHHLETIYVAIREGSQPLTSLILSVTFKSVDMVKELINNSGYLKIEGAQEQFNSLLNEVAELEKVVTSGTTPDKSDTPNEVKAERVEKNFYLSFKPSKESLRNGTNSLYIADDLLSLGKSFCRPYFDALPALEEIDPTKSYTAFEIILNTTSTEEEIKEVFLFLDGGSEVTISQLGTGNKVSFARAKKRMKDISDWMQPVGQESLAPLFESEIKSEEKKQVQPQVAEQKAKHTASIRVDSSRLDDLMNLVSELVTTQARLSLLADSSGSTELSTVAENVEKITRRLRDNAFTMSLIPIESLVVRFQRLVRDLSNDLGKKVIFKAEGAETEIDKSIIEKITDPLLHLLRNSLDHGIEKPEERIEKGKAPEGLLLLKSYYSGANVIIEITDDGAGINVEKIRKKALQNGLITAEAKLSDKEILNLIFMPGFSTAEKVTGVSGRGVGMDVVKRNIADIRGEVEVSTREGQGTTFTIKLPLTLSIIDGLLVEIGTTRFIIPLFAINKCYEANTALLASSFNHWTTLDGKRTPFLYLRRELAINGEVPELSQIIGISHDKGMVGIAVDKIIGEYQAVLKPLGMFYSKQEEFSGATILGDGSVALVLDTNKLVRKLTVEQDNNKVKSTEYEYAN